MFPFLHYKDIQILLKNNQIQKNLTKHYVF